MATKEGPRSVVNPHSFKARNGLRNMVTKDPTSTTPQPLPSLILGDAIRGWAHVLRDAVATGWPQTMVVRIAMWLVAAGVDYLLAERQAQVERIASLEERALMAKGVIPALVEQHDRAAQLVERDARIEVLVDQVTDHQMARLDAEAKITEVERERDELKYRIESLEK